MKKIILASASPRRSELLTAAGISFVTVSADVDETLPQSINPRRSAMYLAEKKAQSVFTMYHDDIVIGADTIVVMHGKILGKPSGIDEARMMLKLLSGKTHRVYTGVSIVSPQKIETFAVRTDVTFFRLSDNTIESYLKTGDSLDKAGAYGIQSSGGLLVKKINGDYNNVVGLPIGVLARKLESYRFSEE